MLAHRGITHSLSFAAALALLIAWWGFPGSYWRGFRLRLWLGLALAGATHGLLDMLTQYAGGVALFAPFSAERFFFPFRPLAGAPAGPSGSVLTRVAAIAAAELLVVWIPSIVLILGARRMQRAAARAA